MTAREIYDGMVKDRIGLELREEGFRRRRNRLSRRAGGAWQVIDFQASQWGSRDEVSFTVNLHVVFPELEADSEAWTPSRPPPSAATHLQERIGGLLPENEDLWWKLDAVTDTAALAEEVLELLQRHASAWFGARSDLDRFLAQLPEESSRGLQGYELARMQMLLDKAGKNSEAELVRQEMKRRGIALGKPWSSEMAD